MKRAAPHRPLGELGIVGAGFMGASVALAAKAAGVASRAVALVVPNQPAAADDAQRALDIGAVDELRPLEAPGDLPLAIVCTPVHTIGRIAAQLLELLPSTACVFDLGSAKGEVVAEVQRLTDAHRRFVGCHPIAGSHHTGPAAASERLFDGKLCVLTPVVGTDPAAMRLARWFWRGLNMNVVEFSPQQHDDIVARTSHLPHLVAGCLLRILSPGDSLVAGSGLRDTTRIAAGSPVMWRGIVAQNRTAILAAARALVAEIEHLVALAEGDEAELERWLSDAKSRRDALGSGTAPTPSGPG